MSNSNSDYYFLRGGGAMGELIRAKDWSKTAMGDPADWPLSLRTMVAVMLDNPFGMYIAWGKEYTQIYNDGYRPILGATKHPQALGISTRETFSEIWHIIESMFDGVMEGKAVGYPDLMLPLNRYGFVEECYFDFSYSPIRKDDGEVGGVLVTVIETTEKKRTEKALVESNSRYINNILQAPVAMCIFRGKNHTVEIANDQMLQLWGKQADQVINKPIFEGLPEAKDQGLEELLDRVYTTGEKFVANERAVNLPRNGKVETTYVNFIYEALKEPDGTISGIIATATEVTDQVIARQKIEESEKQFNTLANNIQNLTWMADGEGYRFWYNQRWYDYTGTTFEEMKGWGWEKVHHPDHVNHVVDFMKKAWHVNQPFELTYPLRGANGEYRWFLSRVHPVTDDEGKITNWIGTNTDITEQKSFTEQLQIEVEERTAELKASEEKFYTLFNLSPVCKTLSDGHSGKIVMVNDAFINTFGYSRQETINKTSVELGMLDLKTREITLNELTAHGKIQNKEMEFIKKSGKKIYALTSAEAIKIGDKQFFIGAYNDISDRKNAEKKIEQKNYELEKLNKELIEQKEFSETILNTTPELIGAYDTEMHIIAFNKACEDLFQIKKENVIGKKYLDAFPAATDSQSHLDLVRALKGERIHNSIHKSSLTEKYFENFIIPVFDPLGNVYAAIAIAHDITDVIISSENIKKINEELQEKNSELLNLNKELQSFAYISSHDLQEPLRKIQTFATRISEKEENNLSEYGKDMFNRMLYAAKRMQTLIQDLLAYSRANTSERKFETTDLNVIMAEVKEDLKEELQAKNASIEVNQLCNADIIPFQFRQLMHNLIGNSLKFSKPNQPPLIQIKSEIVNGIKIKNEHLPDQNKYCHITFSDNGIGFEEQYNEKIFEVFQRLHGKNEYIGTGIGLSIVKKIVENHHGIITATGALNKGATFDIYIPVT